MHIVGGGKMYIYPASDENPHPPGLEQNWQESFLVHFWDPHLSVGVYVRIGHEPNFNGGVLRLFSNVITPNGIFHRVEEVPLRAGDVSANGISADGGALNYAFDGTRIRWHVAEPGVTADLEIEDFHAAIDGYPKSGKLSEYVAQHVEVACRVTGTVTTQGKAYQVDGMGMRDHGWGIRQWDRMVSHRWTVATFDRDNSFCAITFHTTDDVIAKFGWVIRGDQVIHATHVDIVAFVEADGISNRGGITRMVMPSGEVFEARFEAVTPCVTCEIHGSVSVDNFCRVTWGDRVGVGDFELSANALRGSHIPRAYEAGTIDANGWHPATIATEAHR